MKVWLLSSDVLSVLGLLKIALLSFNSHTLQLQWFSVHSELCNHSHRETPCPQSSAPKFSCPPPHSPWKSPVYLLSLWTCLFWTFPIDRIIHMWSLVTGFFLRFVWRVAEAARSSSLPWVLLPPTSLQVMGDWELQVAFKNQSKKKVQMFSGNFVTDILMLF